MSQPSPPPFIPLPLLSAPAQSEEVLVELRPFEAPPLLMAIAGVLVASTAEELALFEIPGLSPVATVENRADPVAVENDGKATTCVRV